MSGHDSHREFFSALIQTLKDLHRTSDGPFPKAVVVESLPEAVKAAYVGDGDDSPKKNVADWFDAAYSMMKKKDEGHEYRDANANYVEAHRDLLEQVERTGEQGNYSYRLAKHG